MRNRKGGGTPFREPQQKCWGFFLPQVNLKPGINGLSTVVIVLHYYEVFLDALAWQRDTCNLNHGFTMSLRDRSLLDGSGLTVINAAQFLGVTRQALYQWIADEVDHLDADRVVKLFREFRDRGQDSEAERLRATALTLGIAFDEALKIFRQKETKDIYIIVSNTPFELTDSEYMSHYMVPEIFTACKKVMYICEEKVAKKIENQIGLEKKYAKWAADIVIIESNLPNFLPHTVLCMSKENTWTTLSYNQKKGSMEATEHDALYTSKLKSVLQDAGFDFRAASAEETLSSKQTETDGIRFQIRAIL